MYKDKKIKVGSDYEKWIDINNYEGFYQVSNFGQVRSLDRISNNPINKIEKGVILLPNIKKGYKTIVLQKSGERKYISVHRLVAIAFIPNPFNLPQVNHKDGDKLNNNDWNLEWNTSKQNVNHSWDNGMSKPILGINHGNAKLNDEKVIDIRQLKGVLKHKEIAEIYNISRSVVQSVINKKSWKHVL